VRTEAAGIAHLPVRDAAIPASDPQLWPDLQPGGPAPELLLVDLGEACAAPPEVVTAAAARIGASDRVVVGTSARPLARLPATGAATLLLDSLTMTVVPGAGRDRRVVRHDDPPAAVAALAAAFAASPGAGTVLRQVLAATARLPVRDGLRAESFAYSTLMAGPEFSAWLARRPPRRPAAAGQVPVRATRDGGILTIELDDPSRRNAYSAAMREALLDALSVAAADPGVHEVRIRGRGPAFCSGGDLAEFGTGPGGSTAHFVRTQRSPGLLMHRLRDRVRVDLHGACVGAGIELPAFAGWLSARPDTVIRLPEIAMGLIPGAGGTVSITRRIGRWRTAYLALSGLPIDAPTALDWGLVDEITG
jgi:enoyl-CoA hydratase/carnithine racemase